MKQIKDEALTGERAAYASKDTEFINCIFEDGESPIKESTNIKVINCDFKWKYPLWYCKNVEVIGSTWHLMGRSGIWYTDGITIKDSLIDSPKQFRRSKNIVIKDTKIPEALETMWKCENIELENVYIKGDYFGMNSSDIKLNNVVIDGNYCFDGAKNIVANNCIFNSKDSFWNCENVTITDSKIIGEYLSWNSKNITFINCELESEQGLCYMENVKLVNCKVNNTNLAFEFCKNIDADITTKIDSIKNPLSGIIRCKGYDELIMDEKFINPNDTKIEVK